MHTEPYTPIYVFTGELTCTDHRRYLALPFHVPADTTHLHLDFQFVPWKVNGAKNVISLSLYEPDGAFRGCHHEAIDAMHVEVGAGSAVEGFFPGPLPPGEWIAELASFAILPGSPVHYELKIGLSCNAEPEVQHQSRFPRPTVRQQPGWYRGDLHVHTRHSDGVLSVAEFASMVRQRGLDFVALTDHNNVTQLYHPDLDGVYDLAIIPGMELTTYYGHALALGTTGWFDWRIGRNGRKIQQAADEIHARGGLFVAAHIAAIGDPVCTGCKWLFQRFMPGGLDAVEIWNETWAHSNNEISLQVWYSWLNAGHRLPATAGSDAHGYQSYEAGPGFNVIWAEALSADGILDGLRRGHVMLSSGPRLWIEAPLPTGAVAMMGDAIPAGDGVVPITVRWEDAPAGATARLVVDGDVQASWVAGSARSQTVEVMGLRWVVAELRSAQGLMLALTNPIYLDRELNL